MKYVVTRGSESTTVDIEERDARIHALVGETALEIDMTPVGEHAFSLIIDGRSHTAMLLERNDTYRVMIDGTTYEFRVEDADLARLRGEVKQKAHHGAGMIRAPMPGRVIAVEVEPGDAVTAGQGVVVIEAMKMENELRSHMDARVKEVLVKAGDAVNKNDVLVVLEA